MARRSWFCLNVTLSMPSTLGGSEDQIDQRHRLFLNAENYLGIALAGTGKSKEKRRAEARPVFFVTLSSYRAFHYSRCCHHL
jgi:hypothetical protein